MEWHPAFKTCAMRASCLEKRRPEEFRESLASHCSTAFWLSHLLEALMMPHKSLLDAILLRCHRFKKLVLRCKPIDTSNQATSR